MIEGEQAMPAGRALDLGCGSSPNVRYLAQHGWDATGVDFSATAIRRAREAAKGISGATFLEADVTKLRESGLSGQFDLVLDYGCFHTLGNEDKRSYVAEVAAVMKSGAPLIMWEGIRMKGIDMPGLFGSSFVIENVEAKPFVVQRMKRHLTINGTWYRLRRK
ncbi:MAG: class I SAM-dependent methyltransferase [Actinomycetia bacterium]|nr:class I SAM-dependent methyltransferase [Actinomycetes bacterium]MCH9702616.1 class I SAM-dependent methyltransferase [Actinomycetes bacterium]